MTFLHRRTFRLRQRLGQSARFVLPGLLAALVSGIASADDIGDINKLVRAGQHAEALARADAVLAKNPKDAQTRFLKGVILAEQNKSAEAIAVFSRLAADYPSMPEPHNNLAVLYAASGNFEKARAELNAAIRTNPSYAVAFANLGDVHAKLASQEYDKALQLDQNNAGAKANLTLVRSLSASAQPQTPALPPQALSLPKPATPQPPAKPADQVAMAKPEAREAPARPAPPKTVEPPPAAKPAPKPEAPKAEAPKPEAPKPAPKPEAPKAVPEQDEVLAAVRGWAKAWSTRDMASYFASYGSNFDPDGGLNRKAWEEERRARIVGKNYISVKIDAPKVSISGDTATVRFRQTYTSDRLTSSTRKTLVLAKQGGKWKIRQEIAGS